MGLDKAIVGDNAILAEDKSESTLAGARPDAAYHIKRVLGDGCVLASTMNNGKYPNIIGLTEMGGVVQERIMCPPKAGGIIGALAGMVTEGGGKLPSCIEPNATICEDPDFNKYVIDNYRGKPDANGLFLNYKAIQQDPETGEVMNNGV